MQIFSIEIERSVSQRLQQVVGLIVLCDVPHLIPDISVSLAAASVELSCCKTNKRHLLEDQI